MAFSLEPFCDQSKQKEAISMTNTTVLTALVGSVWSGSKNPGGGEQTRTRLSEALIGDKETWRRLHS